MSAGSRNEDEFFAREDALKLQKLHQEKLRSVATQEREAQKQLHHMHCPKCGWNLQTIQWRDVEVEKCLDCGAIVLDDGELEKLAGSETSGTWVRDFFSLFSGSEKSNS
ncbi:MAG: zf-TFIIB domain-containing protein [Myxococcota bacterium]